MQLSGWLALNKPEGVSSFSLVSRIRKQLSDYCGASIKAGHTGTLDPFASGVLPIALGEAVKLSRFFLDCDKAYLFTLTWGAFTDTEDKTGAVISESSHRPALAEIEANIPRFTGKILQKPPRYSAIHIDGKRAYALARKNIAFEIPAREVEIYKLEILEHSEEQTVFYTECSKGTYIRSLARDIATACGAAGHVSALQRKKSGFFSLNDTIIPDKTPEILYKSVQVIEAPLVGIPALHLDQFQYADVTEGRKFLLPEADFPEQPFVMYHRGFAVGIGEVKERLVKPVRRLHNPNETLYADIDRKNNVHFT